MNFLMLVAFPTNFPPFGWYWHYRVPGCFDWSSVHCFSHPAGQLEGCYDLNGLTVRGSPRRAVKINFVETPAVVGFLS